MKYRFLYIFIFTIFLVSCDFLQGNKKGSSYSANIAWESDSFLVNHYGYISLVDSAVYAFGEAAPGSGGELLVKVDAKTGSVIWKTEPFPTAKLTVPIVSGNYVYVFVGESLIYSFELETGKLSAIIETDTENTGLEIEWNAIAYENYLYFGVLETSESYLARLDTTDIVHTTNSKIPQNLSPENVWSPESGGYVLANLITQNNIIYCLTYGGLNNEDWSDTVKVQ
jgi:outer membrane protein assembly factor BamB